MLNTCVAVREARARWLSLPVSSRHSSDHLAVYVQEVEDALGSEGSDWERGLRLAHQSLTDRRRR